MNNKALYEKAKEEIVWNIDYYSSRIVQAALSNNDDRLNESVEKLKLYSYLKSLIDKDIVQGETNEPHS